MRLNCSCAKKRVSGQCPRNGFKKLLLLMVGLRLISAIEPASADEEAFRAYLDEIVFASPEKKVEARILQKQRRLNWAHDQIAIVSRRIQANPLNGAEYLRRAHAYLTAGDTTKAKADLRQALALSGNDPSVLSAAAWGLATTPVDSYRDGQWALKLAEKACRLTTYQNVQHLEVFAAAQAEVGRFDLAMAWQRRVVSLCSSKTCSRCEFHLAIFQERTTLAQYAKHHDVVWFP